MSKYSHVTVSGTFDHLHTGHEHILGLAFKSGAQVSIGLTIDNFVKTKEFSAQIESFETRKAKLQAYLRQQNFQTRAVIFPLSDIYGIALTDETLEAIVVTKETHANAVKINKERTKKGFNPLAIIEAKFIKSHDNKIIRSTRIRAGEITRNGKVYAQLFKDASSYHLPISLRESLRDPLGIVIKGEENDIKKAAEEFKNLLPQLDPNPIISVGDITTTSLMQVGIKPDVSVIDFKTKRHELTVHPSAKEAKYRNTAGTISRRATEVFHKKLREKQKSQLFIEGEEDLIALPAILLAPLGSVVVYGQFGLGIVVVEVTEEIKGKIQTLFEKFERAA